MGVSSLKFAEQYECGRLDSFWMIELLKILISSLISVLVSIFQSIWITVESKDSIVFVTKSFEFFKVEMPGVLSFLPISVSLMLA